MTEPTLAKVLAHLEVSLAIPATMDYSREPPVLVTAVCEDCSVLTCGCLISANLANQLQVPRGIFKCPACHATNIHMIGPCDQVRRASKYVLELKRSLRRESDTESNRPNLSLLTAFNEAFSETQSVPTNGIPRSTKSFDNYTIHDRRLSDDFQSSGNSTSSSLHSFHRQKSRSSQASARMPPPPPAPPMANESNREVLFAKNFPFFRKIYEYNTHRSKFFPKTKLFISTAISPKLTRMVLVAERKWEVYSIDTNHPELAPRLLCCGKNNGEYGQTYDSLQSMTRDEIVRSSNFADTAAASLDLLSNWEHISCRVTGNLLVIAGTRGFLRVIDISSNGRCLYTYQCKFPIRCIDVSPDEQFIAIGVTGKDKYTLIEQAFIILLKLDFSEETISVKPYLDTVRSSTSTVSSVTTAAQTLDSTLTPIERRTMLQLTPYPFNLPYRDPITHLQFSHNSKLLALSTALESRFMVINLEDPTRPALVMKSQRRLDTSLDSEGITDVQFFPDNRLMSLTSVAYNSVPIVIDTNISSSLDTAGVAKPKLLLKLDEIGNNIHKCCVSPRGDALAYLDRSGAVYIIMCPKMGDIDNKRVVMVTNVTNASTVKESASIRFDENGYKLYIIDRKGLVTIADFTAGTVEDHSVTRCKIIS